MKIFINHVLISVIAVLSTVTPAAAQVLPHVIDKTHGEEEQILERERWFIETRGLDKIDRPDLLRKKAVEELSLDLAAQKDPAIEWSSLGPRPMTMLDWVMGNVAGRVSAVAIDPTDEDIIYLGAASGGLWKTVNGGTSWTQIFDSVGTQSIGSITLDPSNNNTVWVGTGEQGQYCNSYFGLGLFVSHDAGATFTEMNGTVAAPLDLSYISSIVVDPVNAMHLLVGGHGFCDPAGTYYAGGLFRSTDGGLTWTRKYYGPVSDIIVDPAAPTIWYSAWGRWGYTNDGVYKSTDSGVSWTRLTNGIPYGAAVARIRLVMAPSSSQVLYALVNEASVTKLYQTTNGGTLWTTKNSDACEGQCDYNLCIAIDPFMPSSLVLGTIRHATSTDSGATLSHKTDTWGNTQTVHQDTHVVVYSKITANRYWVGTDGGLWRTDDGGATFTNLNSNLDITQFYDIVVHPDDNTIVFGGSQDNSSLRRNGDPIWNVTIVSGDGFMNLVDPGSTSTVFQTSYPSGGYPWLCKSTSGGAPNTCDWMNPGGLTQYESYPWVTAIAIADPDPIQPSQLFLGSSFVYRAQADQAAATFVWTKISPDLTSGASSISVITPFVQGNIIGLYVGTANGMIWRIDDVMAASPIWNNVTGNYQTGRVNDIAVDLMDPNRVFVARGEFGAAKVFRSTVGGSNWQDFGLDLPDVPANAVAIDPLAVDRVFVGNDVGLFMSTDDGISFSAAGTGLPLGLVVTDLEIDDNPYYITAGTYGRGAWQANLAGNAGIFADDFETGDTTRWSSTSTAP